jgi:uncharacterized membrane protein YjjP (DUF1212 family)
MGKTAVFNNQIFESWLDKKSDEILSKVDREKISTEEMIILILKAQTNHFDHMDVEIKSELQTVNQRLSSEMQSVNYRIDGLGNRMDHLEKRFDNLDKKVDSRFMWTIGLMAAGFSGLYLKLFFP